MNAARRGIVLPVVLVLIGLLAVIMAGFMFFARAELSGIEAQRAAQQARLAAESGLEEVSTVLRASPDDPTGWLDVPGRFRHALVWSEKYYREDDPVRKMGSRKELLAQGVPAAAWRYSVVSPNYDGPPDTFRYGVTPEAGKLNLNTASEAEIERLVLPLLMDLGIENAQELVAALLDWRDQDTEVRPGGAEDEYYTALVPGYHAKNGRMDTVEEILLVKGWTAAALYGEDTNRNGLLDRNEDDGDQSFPYYDNGDGQLNPGIAPFVTVWSREPRAAAAAGQGQPQLPGQGQATPAEQGGAEESGPPDLSPGVPASEGRKFRTRQQGRDQPDDPDAQQESGDGQPPSASQPPSGGGQTQVKEGLVNVNTAPLRVLQALDGMPPDVAEAIVIMRQQQSGEALKSPEWLVTSGAMDRGTYEALKEKITTRALQFHVEIVGYGDHTRLAQRHEWIVEMRGAVAQVLYHRDLTGLGFAWPIDDDKFLVTGY